MCLRPQIDSEIHIFQFQHSENDKTDVKNQINIKLEYSH